MNDENIVMGLVDKIGKVLDGHENAHAVQALISSLALMILMSISPDERNRAMVFIFKTLRELVKRGTKKEREYIQ